MNLRPYQIEAAEAVLAAWNEHQGVLLTMATGLGKTQVFCEVLDRAVGAGRGLVLVHRKELVEQARDRLLAFWPHWQGRTGIVMAERDECATQIVFATVQTLASEKRLARLLAAGPIDVLVTDECFPSGTLVDGRPIETIAIGDVVTAWDERGGRLVSGRVTRTFQRPAPRRMVRVLAGGVEIICTPEHPILVNGRWTPAVSIKAGDGLVITGAQHGAPQPNVLHLQARVLSKQESVGPLAAEGQDDVLAGMRAGATPASRFGDGLAHEPALRQRTHEAQQPNASAGCARKDARHTQSHRLGSSPARRQWRIDAPTSGLGGCAWVADGSRNCDGLHRQGWFGLSGGLQGGYWQFGPEDRGRGGWPVSSTEGTPRGGCAQDGAPRIARVDRVEVLERDSEFRRDEVCPDGFVYNLEVEGLHTYTANGIVVHNCHHSAASTYLQIYDALAVAQPGLRHLGVTATPKRADGVGLRSVYTAMAGSYDIRFGVQSQFLVPPRWLAIQTGISLAGIATRYADGEKDYSARQLANVYETANCFDLVVASHKQYAAERQAVAFTVTVEGARQLADAFRANGILAEAASAETDKATRRRILDDFRARRLQVLCNVGLYTEGLDVPEVACIHQVRPTQSDGLYLQMVGRALRLFPGKADALILDYAPLEAREVVMLGDVLGTAARKDVYIAEAKEPGMVQGGFTFDGEFRWLSGSPMELISRQLNYLDASPWRWHRAEDGWLTLGLGKGGDEIERILTMSRPDGDGRVTLFALGRRSGEHAWQHRELGHGELDAIQQQAETIAERHATQILSGKGRAWNDAPPTDGQLKFARRLRISKAEKCSRGELANRINHALAMQALRGAGVPA